MWTSGLAVSTTMKFATDPVIVRFPASVEAIARISHALRGSAKFFTSDLSSMTAGTLLTRLLNSVVTTVNTAGR